MRVLFLSALASLTAPLAVFAASDLVVDLPAGQVNIQRNSEIDPGLTATAAGQKIAIDSAYLPVVVTKHADSALLQVYSGGNACPAEYVWLTLDAKGLTATAPFGTCSEGIEMVATPSYPAAVMPGMGEELGWFRYDFDGKTVTEAPFTRQGDRKAAQDPTLWQGRSAYELLGDEAMRPALLRIMSEAQLGQLRQAVALTVPEDALQRQGDWIVGGGCRAELCDVESGQVAISVIDGGVVAVFRDVDGPKYFGAQAEQLFASEADPDVDLPGFWAIVKVNGQPVSDMADDESMGPSIEFDAKGAASGMSFCNRWIGAAKFDKTAIAISDIALTRMACPHQKAEAALMDVLHNARSWAATDDGLELRTPDGHSILMVRPD